jgi:hypothetical protein
LKRGQPTIQVHDTAATPFPDELTPDHIDRARPIDQARYIARLPAGSRFRLLNALAFVTNEILDFRRMGRCDAGIVSIAARDLRAAADAFESAPPPAPASPAVRPPRKKRRQKPL